MVRRLDGEMYPCTVDDAGRYRYLELMGHQLVARTLAPRARLDPAATTAAALRTGLRHTHRKRNRHSVERVARRQLNRRLNLLHTLVGEKRLADPVEGGRHRRKIDDHFVVEAARFILLHIVERSQHAAGGPE